MEHLTCCTAPSWTSERDLHHAGGFEYTLGKCRRCGTPWMSVYCTASSMSGYERITQADVEAILSMRDARELKEFMRQWAERNL